MISHPRVVISFIRLLKDPEQTPVFSQYSFEVDVNRIKHLSKGLLQGWLTLVAFVWFFSWEKKLDEFSLSYNRPVLFIWNPKSNSFSVDQIKKR